MRRSDLLLGALVLAGVALRAGSRSPLWLDEALSVNIARLPLPELFDALRHDGSPPVYYLLLHGWIRLFGDGNVAVRALSILISLVTLPIAYLAGRRLGGPMAARAALVVLATSWFAIRYATETRMYGLMTLLSLLGLLALLRADERPNLPRLVPIALLTGLLALTHYWGLFLIATTAAVLGLRWRRGHPASGRELVALAAGLLLFAPWLPTFWFQLRHTGTPWAASPHAAQFFGTLQSWWGPASAGSAWTLFLMTVILMVIAVTERRDGPATPAEPGARGSGVVVIGAPTVSPAAGLLATGAGTIVLGLVISFFGHSGYALRYSASAFGPAVLLIALGVRALPPRAGRLVLVSVAVLGLFISYDAPFSRMRTQAVRTAAVLRPRLGPGDVVIYCPDQLGPAVHRLLPPGTRDMVYPTMGSAERIDWVDYAQRMRAASPSGFALAVTQSARARIWLVRADNYRAIGDQCQQLDRSLTEMTHGRRLWLAPDSRYGEAQALIEFDSGQE